MSLTVKDCRRRAKLLRQAADWSVHNFYAREVLLNLAAQWESIAERKIADGKKRRGNNHGDNHGDGPGPIIPAKSRPKDGAENG